ncbi:TetR/AcrR family transcriptional regulator [Macrococcus carouselicus]|nr:TetR/AcrR family transcriptional regulator C-terminal domain-containing protein [Macrococcus carouselicus]
MISSSQSLPKTKILLINTLNDMLKEASIEDITIIALVQKSGITRSTFYTHYHDKYMLFEDLVYYLCKTAFTPLVLEKVTDDHQEWLEQLKKNYSQTLYVLNDHHHVFAQIPAKSRLVAIRNGIALSKPDFINQLEQINYNPVINKEYAANFFLSGLFLTYEQWIYSGYDIPVEELSEQLTHLTAAQFNLPH